jgi:hypothetical protein
MKTENIAREEFGEKLLKERYTKENLNQINDLTNEIDKEDSKYHIDKYGEDIYAK